MIIGFSLSFFQFHPFLLPFAYFYCFTTTSIQQQISVAVEATAAETTAKMPYRTDLKRPDLKGQFPCNVCGKVFCHSSSLSRHRMQAHFKSYTCTQCNQEIASSDTLRSHMYRYHQIQRMFMCRCCNWAFPDKTSLHIHMQSMQKSGMPGDVSVLARSYIDKEELLSPGHHQQDHLSHPSFGSPSYNSSPDEEQQHNRRQDMSSSPSLSESDEKDGPFSKIDVESEKERSPSQIQSAPPAEGGGIFPKNSANFHQYNNFHDHRRIHPTVKLETNTSIEEEQCGCIDEVPSCGGNAVPTSSQVPMSVPSSAPFPPTPSHTTGPTIFQQQWFTQWLANNPFFATALDGYLNNNNSHNNNNNNNNNHNYPNSNISNSATGGAIKGLLTHNHQQQLNVAASHIQHNHSSGTQMAMLQALIAAATSSTAAASAASHHSVGNCSSSVAANASPQMGNGGVKLAMQQHQPPFKKAKTSTGGGKGNASVSSTAAAHQRRHHKGTKSDGGIGTTSENGLSVHIPHNQFHSPFSSNGSANSPSSNDGSKMCALIDSLLHIKRSSGQNSPIDEAGKTNGGRTVREETERRNKRKTRVPTRATEMTEIVYGDEPEAFFEKSEKSELAQAASPNVFPSIQRLMLANSSVENCGTSIHFPSSSADPQQLSPAVSDSQTSGSSNGLMGNGATTTEQPRGMNSPTATFEQTKCHPTGESDDTPKTTDKSNVEPYGDKTRGKVKRICQIVDRITTAAEEVSNGKVRDELIDCARQLQLVVASEQ